MKVYQVFRRGSRWHALTPDGSPGVHASEDRSRIVDWACEAATKHDGVVQVRDIGGQIEMTYVYINSVGHHHDREQSRYIASMLGR